MIDDMVFSDKGSQDGEENNDKVLSLDQFQTKNNNDPRMSIFSMSKASTMDTSARCNNNEESDFGFRSNSTVFKNFDPSNNRSNTVQNKLV